MPTVSDLSTMPDDETAVTASSFKSYRRIFAYADQESWVLYSVAFAAAVAAGSALPLMNLVFGKFVTAFNNFALGKLSPEDYRREVSRYS